jgi:hypothetical protein
MEIIKEQIHLSLKNIAESKQFNDAKRSVEQIKNKDNEVFYSAEDGIDKESEAAFSDCAEYFENDEVKILFKN